MSSIAIVLVVVACVLGAAVLGFWLNAALPSHHLSAESKDSLKAAIGVVGTLTALVFGLLVATAKGSYDAKSNGVAQATTDIVLLDRLLAEYGPEASKIRQALGEAATSRLKGLWSDAGFQRAGIRDDGASTAAVGALERSLRELKPANDQQRSIQTQAL